MEKHEDGRKGSRTKRIKGFSNGKKERQLCEINKYSLLFLTRYYIQHTCMSLLSTCHKLSGFISLWRNLKLRWSLYKSCTSVTVLLQLCVEYRQPLLIDEVEMESEWDKITWKIENKRERTSPVAKSSLPHSWEPSRREELNSINSACSSEKEREKSQSSGPAPCLYSTNYLSISLS